MISDIFAGVFYVKSENHTRGVIHSQIDGSLNTWHSCKPEPKEVWRNRAMSPEYVSAKVIQPTEKI